MPICRTNASKLFFVAHRKLLHRQARCRRPLLFILDCVFLHFGASSATKDRSFLADPILRPAKEPPLQ